jgi:hypothetical protein
MIKYSNEERLKTLNEVMKDGTLTIESNKHNNNVFTILTQWFRAESIEDAADYIIHYKKFLEMYEYDRIDTHFALQSRTLPLKRFEVWFNENRKLTDEEENEAVKLDIEIQKRWDQINEEFSTHLANELFGEFFEHPIDEEKIRKWSMPE